MPLPSSSWTSYWRSVGPRFALPGGRLGVSSTLLCPTRNQRGKVYPTHHQPVYEQTFVSLTLVTYSE